MHFYLFLILRDLSQIFMEDRPKTTLNHGISMLAIFFRSVDRIVMNH